MLCHSTDAVAPALTVFDKTRPKPPWLNRDRFGGKHGKRRADWYNRLWDAQPKWADTGAIRRLYRHRDKLRKEGHDVTVDHIVPLFHPLVCGLHVRDNLRLLERSLNSKKSNHTFPGMSFAQRDLFTDQIAPEDFELEFQNGVEHQT